MAIITQSEIAHLEFIYSRMIDMYGENENIDYMIRFRNIIEKHKIPYIGNKTRTIDWIIQHRTEIDIFIYNALFNALKDDGAFFYYEDLIYMEGLSIDKLKKLRNIGNQRAHEFMLLIGRYGFQK